MERKKKRGFWKDGQITWKKRKVQEKCAFRNSSKHGTGCS
jgi:hypothetical protein